MEDGEVIGRALCQLPDEFKGLLKRKEAGEITQRQLEDSCDAFTLSKLYLLSPKPFPTKPGKLMEFEGLSKKEQKENKGGILSVKSEWQTSRLEIAIENEMNLRELRRLLRKYKDTPEVEKISMAVDKHQEYYQPFREPGSVP